LDYEKKPRIVAGVPISATSRKFNNDKRTCDGLDGPGADSGPKLNQLSRNKRFKRLNV